MKYTIHRYKRISSTSDIAHMLADDDAPEGTVVIAEAQSAGRGRHGKGWSSPPGSGLYLSLILRPDTPFSDIWQMAFVLAVAAAETISETAQVRAETKWPNDILVNGRKVCGILIEAKRSGSGGHTALIAGIGINVNTLEFPAEIAHRATSMALESGRDIDIGSVESSLLTSIYQWYGIYRDDGFDPVIARWRKLDCTSGRAVAVLTSEGLVEGTAIGVDTHGDLLIECADGSRASVPAGEALFRE